jgi:hypothetical protein
MPFFLLRSDKEYPGDSRKAAVVKRYNELYEQNKGNGILVDWAELFAELVEAYVAAKE